MTDTNKDELILEEKTRSSSGIRQQPPDCHGRLSNSSSATDPKVKGRGKLFIVLDSLEKLSSAKLPISIDLS